MTKLLEAFFANKSRRGRDPRKTERFNDKYPPKRHNKIACFNYERPRCSLRKYWKVRDESRIQRSILEWRREKKISAAPDAVKIAKYVDNAVDNEKLLEFMISEITSRSMEEEEWSEDEMEGNILHNTPFIFRKGSLK